MSLLTFPRSSSGLRIRLIALRITGAVVLFLMVLVFIVYGISEYRLHHTYDVEMVDLRSDVVAGSISEGERLGHVFGCSGCHQKNGRVLADVPHVVRLVAPNLTRIVPAYSDSEFVRLVRRGVKRDGTSVIEMPASSFAVMSDDDLVTILAYLRSLPPVEDSQPATTEFHLLGRLAIALGKVPFTALAAPPVLAPFHRPVATASEQGEYLVKTICSHCHNAAEFHDNGWGMVTPPLALMGQAYSSDAFRLFLRTGKALGNRDVGLMSELALEDFSHMTNPEIDAIHVYLNSIEVSEE